MRVNEMSQMLHRENISFFFYVNILLFHWLLFLFLSIEFHKIFYERRYKQKTKAK